ncbi:MAG TPA: hypothetical protein VGE93_13665 [Bryobacteraceae bacterium]
MAKFDVGAALRWARFDPGAPLTRRRDSALPFVGAAALPGSPLLLDTGVYIHQMQGRAPTVVEDLVGLRQINHSTVAIQELMHAVGVRDPRDARTPAAISSIEKQISAMPDHRILAPDAEVLGRAAILSGMLCRLQGYAKDDRHKAHQDCVLFLQAQKLGFAVLTANIVEFDYLLQLLPRGRVLFYRTNS